MTSGVSDILSGRVTPSVVEELKNGLNALVRSGMRDSAAFAAKAYGFDQVGRALLARGRTSEGMALLGLVAQSLPSSPSALVSAGVAHEAMGDEAGAITWYRKAIAIDSLHPRATARLLRLTGPRC